MSRMMHLFRKYQYMLLIVFGVMLMFVFVIGDALTRLTDGGPRGGQADPVVLTWKYGAVRGNELYSQRVRHNMALEFLTEVVQETVRREGTPKGPGVFRNESGSYNPGITIATNEAAIVQKMVLAAKAESLGVVVDNDTVLSFLTQLSDGELTENDLGVIYNKTVKGRMTQQHLFDQLQRELLAQQMLMMSRAGLFVVPPREAWEFQNRMQRQVQTEMVVLKVDDFKDQVTGDPTDVEIKKLYEEGKNRFSNPYSPLPGFARRRKIAFEYVRADSGVMEDEEAAKVKDSITDADIEKYYEENKDRYRVIDLPEDEPETAEPEAAEESEEGKEEPKSDENADNDPAEEPAKKEASKDEAAPTPPAETKPAEDSPAPEKPAEESTPEESVEESEEQGCGDEEEPEADEPATESEPESPQPPAPKPPAPKAPQADAATTADPAPTDAATPPADETPAEATPEETVTEEKPEEPKYKPLNDELRSEIREEIAKDRSRQPARQRLEKAFAEIKKVIDSHGRQLRRIEISESGEKLPPVDYEKLAAEYGFTAGKIDPSDVIEIEAFDLGQAFETTFTSWPPQRVSFAQKAFAENVQSYKAEQIKSAELDVEFLYWKVGEEESFVPELTDIRDEVIEAWKHQKAFELAKTEGDKLAQQAASDEPLGDSLSEHEGLEIIEPSPFSWMSTGSTPFGGAGAPTLSQVEGVEAAGNEFMKSVFSLGQGEVGVAVDEPKNNVYVVRIVAQVPPEEMLKAGFLSAGVTPEISRIAFGEIEGVWRAWYQDLEREMQVKWEEVE
jgi:hypothetical protein